MWEDGNYIAEAEEPINEDGTFVNKRVKVRYRMIL